jgi:hypothetical protein
MTSPYKIAHEIGVSPQAVYKRLTDEFINQHSEHIRKANGKWAITSEGESIIKELFNQVVEPVQQPVQQPLNTENITFLQAMIESLESDLRIEREHSRNLASELVELTRNSQILLKMEQERNTPALLPDATVSPIDNADTVAAPNKKTGILNRIFYYLNPKKN